MNYLGIIYLKIVDKNILIKIQNSNLYNSKMKLIKKANKRNNK